MTGKTIIPIRALLVEQELKELYADMKEYSDSVQYCCNMEDATFEHLLIAIRDKRDKINIVRTELLALLSEARLG
jgi:hypothetical protein